MWTSGYKSKTSETPGKLGKGEKLLETREKCEPDSGQVGKGGEENKAENRGVAARVWGERGGETGRPLK